MLRLFILLIFTAGCLTAQDEQTLKPAAKKWAQNTKSALFEKRFQRKPLEKNDSLEHLSTLKPNILRPRIVGGRTATPQAYPWMVALVDPSGPDLFSSQFCGGSLIHPRWVLTAAHCVVDSTPGSIQVVLGAHNLSDPTGTQRLDVDEIIIHPNFIETASVTNFDVALLRLSSPANSEFTPIPLVDDEVLERAGTLSRVIGWGNTSATDNQFPTTLQEVDVPIVSLARANSTASYDNQITRFMLPAGFAGGGQDSCQGDSGGPLMVRSPLDTGWSVAGIVSFGQGCAQPNFFGIYTSVSSFRDFVLSHIYPNYLPWEQAQGVRGELRDPDGDQRNNLAEFAFRTMPQTADTPLLEYRPEMVSGESRQAITLQTSTNTGEIDYTLLRSTTLQPNNWQPFDLETLTTSTAPVPGLSNAVMRTVVTEFSADEPRAFFQVEARSSESPVTGPRTLNSPGGANGYLTTNDLAHPSFPNRYQKLFSLPNLIAGQSITISGRASQFDIRLELLDANTMEVLQIASSNNAQGLNGEDEFLTFTPDSARDYLICLTSARDGQTGSFDLGCFLPSTLPTVSESSTRSGALQNFDATDPTREPHRVFIDQFLLADHSFDGLQIALTSSFDSTLSVIDFETGKNLSHTDQVFGSPNNTETINFQPIEGQDYLIQVSSFTPNQTGSYQLQISEFVPASITPISTSQVLSGSLDSSDFNNELLSGSFFDDYRLQGTRAGQEIRINLNSTEFDTFLFLLDDTTNQVILFNDDAAAGTFDSELTFTVQSGVNYRIRVSSFSPAVTGSYSLQTTVVR